MIKVTKGASIFLFESETCLFVSFERKQFWILQSIAVDSEAIAPSNGLKGNMTI